MEITFDDFVKRVDEDRKREIKEFEEAYEFGDSAITYVPKSHMKREVDEGMKHPDQRITKDVFGSKYRVIIFDEIQD